MQSSSTFMKIPRPIIEVKKIGSDQWLAKFFILGRNQAKQGIGKEFVAKTAGVLGEVAALVRVCNFYPHLSLETVFVALKLAQTYYVIMNIYFSWKLAI